MWRRSHFKQAQYFVRVGGVDVLLLECPTRVCYQVPECPTRVSHKSVLQERPTKLSYKSVPQQCRTTLSYKSVPQEYPTRVSYKSVPQGCSTRVSYKNFMNPWGRRLPGWNFSPHAAIVQRTRIACPTRVWDCPARVFRESVPQECPTRVFRKSVRQECPARSCKSAPQECPTRVSYKSVPPKSVLQECSARVFRKSVPQKSVLQEWLWNWQLCSANVVQEAVSGSCGLRTVNLCGQITSEYLSVVREYPTRVLRKRPQECPTRVSYKSVLQECPAE